MNRDSIPLPPLAFTPVYRRYLWGGRRLETLLGRPLPEGNDFAESWELVDRATDQSRVVRGTLQGVTLGELVMARGAELLGRHHPQRCFPLLIKLLDVQRSVSVQVHPSDAQAVQMQLNDRGKAEACVVLAAEQGSVIHSGLKRGFDRRAFERELSRGTCELCLHRMEPRVGDCLYLPPGTVHAAGAGVVLFEVQQPSDVTFRIFDWNRLGADGQPRPLHIEQALQVIDFERGPVNPTQPETLDRPRFERLLATPHFVIERWTLTAPQTITADDRCRTLTVIAGAIEVQSRAGSLQLDLGQTGLLPASIVDAVVVPRGAATVLSVYLP